MLFWCFLVWGSVFRETCVQGEEKERTKGKVSLPVYLPVHQDEMGRAPYTLCSVWVLWETASVPPDLKICICNACTLDFNNNWWMLYVLSVLMKSPIFGFLRSMQHMLWQSRCLFRAPLFSSVLSVNSDSFCLTPCGKGRVWSCFPASHCTFDRSEFTQPLHPSYETAGMQRLLINQNLIKSCVGPYSTLGFHGLWWYPNSHCIKYH